MNAYEVVISEGGIRNTITVFADTTQEAVDKVRIRMKQTRTIGVVAKVSLYLTDWC